MLASLVEELPIGIWPLVGYKEWYKDADAMLTDGGELDGGDEINLMGKSSSIGRKSEF